MMHPRSIMVVWDLDETLCHTFFAPDDPSEARKDPRAAERLYHLRLPNSGDAYEHSSGWGTLRNNARQVIRALDANGFKQSVWSAGEHDYVHAMVDVIFKPLGIEPSIVLTRNHCDRVYSHADKKVTIVKNLNLLWNGYRGLNPSNTIIVDNRYDVCVYNSNNHIKVPDYAPSPSDPYGTDDTLRHLLDHLLGHKNVPDVRLITAVSIGQRRYR